VNAELDSPPRAPGWAEPELAWPLAIAAGLAGAWLGVSSGIPGAPAVVATALFAPLWAGLHGRERTGLAAAAALGWAAGFSGGAIGTLLEGSGSVHALPGAGTWARLEVRPWLGGVEPGSPLPSLAAGAAFLALAALLARPAFGVPALFAAALAVGAVSGGVAEAARAAIGAGGDSLAATLVAWPVPKALQLGGGLLLATGCTGPRFSARGGRDLRRRLRIAGLVAGAAGLALEPLLRSVWGEWIAVGAPAGGG
jgi:hypothetical protein